MAALGELYDPLLNWFNSHPNPPVPSSLISSSIGLNTLQPACKSPGSISTRPLYKPSDPDGSLSRIARLQIQSWGCVFNSFDALENQYVQCFKTHIGHNCVFAVGPLSLTGNDVSARGNSGSSSESNDQGTRHQQDDGYGVIPSGFENRVAGRGLVIKGWVLQVLILNHKAVGAFLSHCGWNLVLEGIVGGVMILSWLMEAEQYVNARLLVDDMGVGVRVCEGADSVPDADELGRAIAESMTEGAGVKAKAKDLQQKALAAVSDGGSSMKDLDTFVEELGKLGRRY
ncbi:hypothetical protein PTKIN_Ptkin02bG0029400 [Pterospermum kingtungense]